MENLTQKILKEHLIKGELKAGSPIEIRMDQTLTQDATGTMAYMQLEAMGVDQVKTDLSVSYVDHNTLQNGFMNADDHAYLQSVAAKHGIYFSKPGNGICHQVHLERFATPGKTLIGSDSHTPTSSAMGMIAIGAGGLDVAKAMAGIPYRLTMPEVLEVRLTGQLQHGVSAKDIILELLRRLTVKGGVGKVFEYTGEGVKTLSVYQRATITNMGAELGATTSIFPSDEITKEFLTRQNRVKDWQPLAADPGASYDGLVEIDLSQLSPLAACPNSPDAVKPISALSQIKVDQVAIGSCTNSGYEDMMKVANVLKGKTINPNVSLVISPGSRQVLEKLIETGALSVFIKAGARILECACGPCIGMGQSPKSDGISLRTFNRNFYGRSGTLSAGIYLVSPETAAVSALTGYISDPTQLDYEDTFTAEPIFIDDSMILPPSDHPEDVEIIRGPNIKPLPQNTKMTENIDKKVVIKLPDNITTDHIAPAGAKVLPYRSNIEKLSTFVFMNNKEHFDQICKANNGGIIVAGENYGQGSSREHAALAPMYLGIKAVLAKSFARIHHANLINFGILPLEFVDKADYDAIDEMDELEVVNVPGLYEQPIIEVKDLTKNKSFKATTQLTKEDLDILMDGGALNYIRNHQ
ncbi:MAG: aconitate hydratase [Absicoccus porci]|uniref:Aconitate hydratase n=1 Tax=Absicoccus porci TaxID=2486576 RepID=A0A3N0I4W1_9FIRM|nr:aconitate hydratase [Absicoccus porci]MCI6088473.1 aconitate hydratase [Absicoccus porci]MDD7331068.1 aconitate hydratase [Absicoccus porci]MDY4738797.1 aconitate hydratase [Absicoccus porci]RNM31352.1 aconitate hydratase [Absicoccus porci]